MRTTVLTRHAFAGVVLLALILSSGDRAHGSGPKSLSLLPSMVDTVSPAPFLSACHNMGQWATVRQSTRYLGLAEWALNNASDGELIQCYDNLRANGLQLLTENAVIKTFCQGTACFQQQTTMFERIKYFLNGPLGAVQLDDPMTQGRWDVHISDTLSAAHTCDYISQVRQMFPGIKIIWDEAFPLIPASDLATWMDIVRQSCQDRNTAPPDVFQLDHDWADANHPWNWSQVAALRDAAHAHGMEFGLQFWSATSPSNNNDLEWYTRTRQYAQAVQGNGIDPEFYTVQAMYSIPHVTVPENSTYTFMWTVLQRMSEGLLPSGSPPPPSSVTSYEHIDYVGASFSASSDVSWVGDSWNDQISSIRVPAGRTVILYEHIDFEGASLTLTSDASDLRNYPGPGADGTWNDAVSSIRIQ